MAWNPSPAVADCRDIARKWKMDRVIIIGLDEATGKMRSASYGATKALCADAKHLADTAFDAIYAVLVGRC